MLFKGNFSLWLLCTLFQTENRELDFDVEVAVNVYRQSSSEDDLLLAKKHNLHSWYLKIQLEDNHQFNAALDYLSKLTFTEVNEISFFVLYFCCKFIYNNIWSQFWIMIFVIYIINFIHKIKTAAAIKKPKLLQY